MKLRWGVIGASGIADRRTIPGIVAAHNAELIAVMDIHLEQAERICAKYNGKRAYADVDALLHDKEVEAVYIASPVIFHKEQAIRAARAKKHILIEKPIALTVEEAREVESVCAANGVHIAVGYMMRFHSCHQHIKQLIASRTIGQIVSCRAQLTCWLPPESKNWRLQKSLSGGGPLMDMGVHCIDLLQYLTGSRARKVAAFAGNLFFHYGVEDSASVMMEMDQGIVGYVDVHFNIPDDAARCRLEIYGTNGSILAEGTIGQNEGGKVEMLVAGGDMRSYDASQHRNEGRSQEFRGEGGDLYRKEIESFSQSVLAQSHIEANIGEAIFVQEVVEAAYLSSAAGKVVRL